MPRKETGVRITVDISKYVQLLRSVPVKIQRRAIMSGIREGTRFLGRALAAIAPKRTGFVRNFIIHASRGRVKQKGSLFVGPRIPRPNVYNLLVPGVKPREILPRNREVLSNTLDPRAQRIFFAARVSHPGFPGRPHLWQPVVEANKPEVLRIFVQKVEQVVKEAVAGAR